jgi:hypothetical protein
VWLLQRGAAAWKQLCLCKFAPRTLGASAIRYALLQCTVPREGEGGAILYLDAPVFWGAQCIYTAHLTGRGACNNVPGRPCIYIWGAQCIYLTYDTPCYDVRCPPTSLAPPRRSFTVGRGTTTPDASTTPAHKTDISQFKPGISQSKTGISQFKTGISQSKTDISQFKTGISQSNTPPVLCAFLAVGKTAQSSVHCSPQYIALGN